jgi:hypothetical protein
MVLFIDTLETHPQPHSGICSSALQLGTSRGVGSKSRSRGLGTSASNRESLNIPLDALDLSCDGPQLNG